jgi:hypothetical protein
LYDKIWEWIYANYDVNNYFTPEELLFDVENQFNRDGRYFPPEARDLVKERFQYRREYAEMQARQDEQKQIAEMIGSGKVIESLSDEILDDLRRPEIMGVDISEYATVKETIIPPDIIKFAEKRSVLGRFGQLFRRIFRR